MRNVLPPYAICRQCGETASAALTLDERGQVTCRNCADTSHPRRRCTICARDLPAELHHVASRSRFPAFMTPLCLNCHVILYARQFRWRRDGSAEAHPLAYLVRGALDVVRLFLERSPAADACRQLLAMLGHAALLALGSLRIDTLADVGRVFSGFSAIEGSW